MNSVIKLLPWTDFFHGAQEYGRRFIDEGKVIDISRKIGDRHVVLYRQLGKEIPDWIRFKFKVPIEVLQVFASQPGSIGRIHKDGIARKSALNVPIFGTEQGYTEWFTEQFEELKIDSSYTQIRVTKEEGDFTSLYRIDSEPEFKIKISTPCILNTDKWHRVNNEENSNFRYMISFRFFKNPSFEELCEIIGTDYV